jgi:hypothetical protein
MCLSPSLLFARPRRDAMAEQLRPLLRLPA